MILSKKLVQHLFVILSLIINQILFLADVNPNHSFSMDALQISQQILFVIAIIAKVIFAFLRIHFEKQIKIENNPEIIDFNNQRQLLFNEQIMLHGIFTFDSTISIITLLNISEFQSTSINQVMFEVLYTTLNFILIPQRSLHQHQHQNLIKTLRIIIVFSQSLLASIYLRMDKYPESVRNSLLFILLVFIFVLNEGIIEPVRQSTMDSKTTQNPQNMDSNCRQSQQQIFISQTEKVFEFQKSLHVDSFHEGQLFKTPDSFCQGRFQTNKDLIFDPLSSIILMDLLEIGYLWFDSKGTILQSNKIMDEIIYAKLGMTQQSFTKQYEIKKLDSITAEILSLNQSEQLSKSYQMNGSINSFNRRHKSKKFHTVQQQQVSKIKIKNGDRVFLKDLLVVYNANIQQDLAFYSDKVDDHMVFILESEINGHQLRDYQINLKIVKDHSQLELDTVRPTFIISFTKSKQLDDYKMIQYTYQIMRQLFRTFSHEFGTSLNYLLALTQTAEEAENVPKHIRENYFKPLTRQGKRMHSVVSDMIDYNQILGKEFKMQLGPIKISELLEEVKDIFDEIFISKNIIFQFLMEDMNTRTEIISDRQRIKQVLLNLISNSQKFTYQGQVTIVTSQLQQFGNKYISFSVEDTGIGMTEEETNRLQKFLDKGVKEDFQISSNTAGFGFGVFISNQLAAELSKRNTLDGGGLHFQSEHLVGSKFSFTVLDVNVNLSESSYGTSPYVKIDKRSFMDLRQSQIQSGFNRHFSSNLQFSRANIQSKRTFLISTYVKSLLKTVPPLCNLQTESFGSNNQTSINLNSNNKRLAGLAQLGDIEESEEYLIIAQENESHNQVQQIKFYENKNIPMKKKSDINIKQFFMSEGLVESQKMICQCPKILIVDDEVINIMALQMMLSRYDLLSDHALNGRICLDKIIQYNSNKCQCSRHNYHLIFMDINMSVLDGYQTTEQINQMALNQDFEKPIIVACTAFVDMETKTKCYDLKMDYFLSKPLRKKELESTLRYYELID